jgi:type III secretory pathway component EscS
MISKPSRLQTLLLMLPTWAFAHSVLIFRVLPLSPTGGVLEPSKVLPFVLLFSLAGGFACLASYVAARRAAALGWSLPPVLALLIHVPFFGAGLALWLAATGDEQEKESVSPTTVAGRLVVPFLVAAAACLLLSYGLTKLAEQGQLPLGLKSVGGYFGLATFLALPFAIGVSGGVVIRRAGGTFGQAVGAAMTLIGAVILVLCACLMEGIICVVMAAPIGAAIAFVGVVVGYFLARTKAADGTLQSAAWLSIIVIVALEGWNPPAPLEATTSSEVVINAPAARVWAELHDIRDLPPTENLLFQFGVAHPISTVTDGQGVGAARLCKLSTGDMPEIITVWKPGQELRFKVLSTPPSMRELGFFGQTIDTTHIHSAYASLEGGFKLTTLPDGRTRLVGESHYLLNIAPASYWNLWTEEIVHMVQRRVLEHVKTRAEAGPKSPK